METRITPQVEMSISFNKDVNTSVIEFKDLITQEVVKKIPSEDSLEFKEMVQDMIDANNTLGGIIDIKI